MAMGSDHPPSPTLPLILTELRPISNWYELGVQLKMSKRLLDRINFLYSQVGAERCKREMMASWLETEKKIKWDNIADALERLGTKDIAKRIRHVYLPHSQLPELTGDLYNTPSTETLERSANVLRQCSQLESTFLELVTEVKKNLQSISLSKLRHYVIQQLGVSRIPKKTSTVDQLFYSIRNHFCYLSHSLLDKIIEVFLPDSNIQAKIKAFYEELDVFSKSAKLKDFLEFHPDGKHDYEGVQPVVLKLSSCWLNMSLQNLQNLTKVFFLNESKNLTHMIIQEGCICVRWLVPESVLPLLVSLSKHQVKFMMQVGIIRLTIGETAILEKDPLKTAISQNELANALFQASISGETTKMEILLPLGANPNCTGRNGITPLMLACKNGEEGAVGLLLKANADVNHVNENGNTALMAAATVGHAEIVKLLLAYNANPHRRGSFRHTALTIAAQRNHLEVVSLLVWINANPNVQTENGWTPLMYAATHGNAEMAKLLLRAGALTSIEREETKETAFTEASRYGHMHIVRLLEAHKLLVETKKESAPSITRRKSTPTTMKTDTARRATTSNSSASKTKKKHLGFHTTGKYPISSIPSSIFRPTINRGVRRYTSPELPNLSKM